MTKLQKCRRHYKWPSRLVIKFFMWAIYNSYVIKNFLKPNEIVGKRTLTFHMYVENFAMNLLLLKDNKCCHPNVMSIKEQIASPTTGPMNVKGHPMLRLIIFVQCVMRSIRKLRPHIHKQPIMNSQRKKRQSIGVIVVRSFCVLDLQVLIVGPIGILKLNTGNRSKLDHELTLVY